MNKVKEAKGLGLLDVSGRGVIPQHQEGNTALSRLLLKGEPETLAGGAAAARRAVAALLNVVEEQVVLTSGGVEACNAAIKGLAMGVLRRGGGSRRIVLSAAEPSPILHPSLGLEALGFTVIQVPCAAGGRIDAEAMARAMDSGAALAAVHSASEELGVVQPVAAVAAAAAARGVPLVVDATSAAGWIPVDAAIPGIAAVAVSSRKLGGPPGIGALILAGAVSFSPLIEGGVEEGGRRAGECHPALAAALALSATAARRHLLPRAAVAAALGELLAAALRSAIPGLHLHGAGLPTLPGHLHVSISGADGEALVLDLAHAGIEAGTASPCASGAGKASRVLLAAGLDEDVARTSLVLRLTASHDHGIVPRLTNALTAAVTRLRALAP